MTLRPGLIKLAYLILLIPILSACSQDSSEPTKVVILSKEEVLATEPAVAGDPSAGKHIYQEYCHYCHGPEGRGDGPVATAISPHPANFVEDAKRLEKSDAELYESISKGIHKDIGGDAMRMPRWMDILTPQERWDVLAYIRYLSTEGQKKDKGIID